MCCSASYAHQNLLFRVSMVRFAVKPKMEMEEEFLKSDQARGQETSIHSKLFIPSTSQALYEVLLYLTKRPQQSMPLHSSSRVSRFINSTSGCRMASQATPAP